MVLALLHGEAQFSSRPVQWLVFAALRLGFEYWGAVIWTRSAIGPYGLYQLKGLVLLSFLYQGM